MPHAFFETPLGRCAIAWSGEHLVAMQLPNASDEETRARLLRDGFGGDEGAEAREAKAPPFVRRAIERIARHLGGAPQSFEDLPVNYARLPPFHARVYEAARRIPAGTHLTYGELAALAGKSAGAARAVGQAMARNPFLLLVPCHRVHASGGGLGGFSAYGGLETKRRLLTLERPLPPGRPETGGLRWEPEEARRFLREADPKLARVIDAVGAVTMVVRATQAPFHALAEAIVYQQLTGKAAATIFGRVLALVGPLDAVPAAFTPEALLALPDDALRGAGLSRAKTAALRDLAAKALDGTVPTLEAMATLDGESIVKRLTAIRGVGRWTVEMLLMFRLGLPDVLPVDDYGVRKGFARTLRLQELPTKAALAARAERWRPFRSAASWYLWRACELPDDAFQAPRAKARQNGSDAPMNERPARRELRHSRSTTQEASS